MFNKIKHLALAMLASVGMWGQSQTPHKVYPSAAGAAAETRLYTSGGTYMGIKAPASIASSFTWTGPTEAPAIDSCVAISSTGVLSYTSCATRRSTDYNWSQSVGNVSPGTLTVTFTSCPTDGTNTDYAYRLYDGMGSEIVTSDGAGTCTLGGSGTITGTVAGTYTGATATSASNGIQEAVFSVVDAAPVAVYIPLDNHNIYAPIKTQDRQTSLACESIGTKLIPKTASIAMIHTASNNGIVLRSCHLANDDSLSGVTGLYVNNLGGSHYGAIIVDNWFSRLDKSIHSVTTNAWFVARNHVLDLINSTSAFHFENVENGDTGVGLVADNILTCAATCTYGILWNSPGGFQLKRNNINGYTTQVHLEPKFGTASASGTTMTWASGAKFRNSWAGKPIAIGGTTSTIVSVDSDTQITLGDNVGTLSADSYYVAPSSQVNVSSNNIDGGANSNYGIRYVGTVLFQNIQLDDNFFSNWGYVNSHKAIQLDGSGGAFVGVRGNNIMSPTSTTGVVGIDVQDGYVITVSGNQVVGSDTGIVVGSGALLAQVMNNHCQLNDTACLTNAASDTIIKDATFTYANLPTAASGSSVFCSDCKQAAAGCAASGTGATAEVINGVWRCTDNPYQPWTVSGSDIYYNTGKVGIGGLTTAKLTLAGGSGDNVLYIADGTATTNVQLYASNGFSVLGTYSNHPLIFAADSAGRWRLSETGMIQPELGDTYDLGNLGSSRIRGVYTKIVDTAISGGTGDYIQTRKLQLYDNTGSTSAPEFWDLNVVSSGIGAFAESYFYLRDPAGVKVFQAERERSGVAVDRTFWYTDLLPDTNIGQNLGSASYKWGTLYVDLIGSSMYPAPTNTYQLGGTSNRFSAIYTVDLNVSGTCTGCGAGLPAVDTTAIVAGSVDATKLLRFEVDGFTTATTRVLTPQNASYTLAGTDLSQTFGNTQTFTNGIEFASSTGSKLMMYSSGASNKYELAVASTALRVIKDYNTSKISFGYGSSGSYTEQVYIDNSRFSVGNLNIYSSSGSVVIEGDLEPQTGGAYDLGNLLRWGNAKITTLDVSSTSTFGGAITANGGIATGSSTNSTIYVGSGNMYLRTFSGGDANCTGVTDGWVGIRTDTNEIQVCIGGAVKKGSLI